MNYDNLARLILEGGAEEPASFGFVGGENDNGAYAIRVPDEPNQIYVRVRQGDRETQIEAINVNVPISPDYPVLIYYRNKQAYAIPDPEKEVSYRQTNEGLSTVAPHSHEPGFGNFDVVSTIRMREGQASLSDPYSMVVDINALKYWDTNGAEKWFTGNSIDLTDFLPVTTDTHLIVKITLDRVVGELVAWPGEEKSILIPLTEQDLTEIITSSRYKPLTGVILYEGMTAIDDMKYIIDWRFWIADFAEGATGVTGATGTTVEDLDDLSDVSSASQFANFVLAAGNGTGAGDYRGRLLVPNDIPNLDASKITSGVFTTSQIPNLDASKITSGALAMARGGFGVDVSTSEGYAYLSANTVNFAKRNFTTTNPTTGDDNNDGYVTGSQWINTSTDEEFVCLDASIGAAIWKSTTSSTGTAVHTDTVDPTVNDDSGDGYAIGDFWVNTTTPEAFIVLDVSVGAAVWMSLSSTGSGLEVRDVDTNVSVSPTTTLVFPNNRVIDNGGGEAEISFNPIFHGVKLKTDTTSFSSTSGITFTAEDIDTDGYANLGVNSDRFTIPTGFGGVYRVNWTGTILDFDFTSQVGWVTFDINHNTGFGNSFFYTVPLDFTISGLIAPGFSVELLLNMSAGDYIVITVDPNFSMSGSLYIFGFLTAQWVGAN